MQSWEFLRGRWAHLKRLGQMVMLFLLHTHISMYSNPRPGARQWEYRFRFLDLQLDAMRVARLGKRNPSARYYAITEIDGDWMGSIAGRKF